MDNSAYRVEHDPIGSIEVPAARLHGPQTERARRNFALSGVALSALPQLIVSLAQVKKAAALTNRACKALDGGIADAIVAACDEIIGGAHHGEFVVDVCQGGAGTSTNMNMNEVVANRALELLGHARGRYDIVSPNDHVNRSQSTNDAYATAVRLTVHAVNADLVAALERLALAMARKAQAFAEIPKLGRTQLQDAVPMTLGGEFGAYATTIGEDAARAGDIATVFLEVNLGGTAIGTGVGASAEYRATIGASLASVTELPIVIAPNLIEATWDTGAFVLYSGMLKRVAAKLSKIANDLRLLSSGPAGGIGEIHLPALQPGSSIMPGKVNPVIPEAVNSIAFRVFGLDTTITFAAEAGQLQLNAFEPVMIWSLHEAASLLVAGVDMLIEKCIDGIEANAGRCRRNLTESAALATELVPLIGYARAAEVAKAARQPGGLIAAVALLEPQLLDFVHALADPGVRISEAPASQGARLVGSPTERKMGVGKADVRERAGRTSRC